MHFETKFVNGKPQIFFKEGQFNPVKKINTKDTNAKKNLNRSLNISGEIDLVIPSPNLKKQFSANTALANESAMQQTRTKNIDRDTLKSLKKISYNPSISEDENQSIDLFSGNNRVVKESSKIPFQIPSFDEDAVNGNGNYIETHYDVDENYNKTQNHKNFQSDNPIIFKNTMTLAEKKRIQWQQEIENLESVARQSNSINDLSQYAAKNNNFNYEKTNLSRTPNSMDNLTILPESNHYPPPAPQNRSSLMEKKKQKWNQDLKEQSDPWSPFARNDRANKALTDIQNTQEQTEQELISDLINPKSKKYKSSLDEYQSISKTLEAIAAVEKKIKLQDQLNAHHTNKPQEIEHKKIVPSYDQSKVPAAMRTSLMFGDVIYDDDIKKTKELERKKWLEELETQKRDKLIQSQRSLFAENNQTTKVDNYNQSRENYQPKTDNQQSTNANGKYFSITENITQLSNRSNEEKSFARTRFLLDPAQVDDLERKKQKNLQHMREIEAQIIEKKKLRSLENDAQSLNSYRTENQVQQVFANKPQQNDSNLNYKNDKNDNDKNGSDVKTKEIFKMMQLAELAAAEEKHIRLLKRLKHGGHDTRNLENKFSEYKSKILSNTREEAPDDNVYREKQNDFKASSYENNINKNGREIRDIMQHNTTSRNQDQNQMMKPNGSNNNNNNHGLISERKIKQIFNILREDTDGIPAEISEDHLKALLKNVMQNENNPQPKDIQQQPTKSNRKANSADKPKVVKQPTVKTNTEKKPPIWNYKNLQGRKAISNSQKDPFYSEKKERQLKRLEQKQNIVDKNNSKFKEYISYQEESNQNRNQNDDYNYQNNASSRNSPSSLSNQPTTTNRKPPNNFEKSKQQNNESVLGLLNKNLATNTIYEEDETRVNQELFYKPRQNRQEDNKSNMINSARSDFENGFVPFMRTNEFLDPVHATSPIPPSRETSAIKRDREKARQAYFQNMKPADHGKNLQTTYDTMNSRNKDPLLNNGLVKNNPTPRQAEILSQLAALKQSLIKKQKEVASSIALDSADFLDD